MTDPLAVLGIFSGEDIVPESTFKCVARCESRTARGLSFILGLRPICDLAIYNDQRPKGHDTRLGI